MTQNTGRGNRGQLAPGVDNLTNRYARNVYEVDYTNGGSSRPSIYERPQSLSAPAVIRMDAVRRAQYEAAEQNCASGRDGRGPSFDWAAIAEIGEQEWLREQARSQMTHETEPYVHAAYFEAPCGAATPIRAQPT